MPIFKLNDKEPILPDDGRYWVAPDANIIGDVRMEVNSSVWFSATLRGDCEEILIGENSNVQDGSVLHTDYGFPLKIGKNVLLSANSTIVGNIKIGDNTKIGAGSVVLNDIPKDCTAVGVPAKIINN